MLIARRHNFWAVILAAMTTGLAGCLGDNFPFYKFERNTASETDIVGATRELNRLVPLGSPLSSYSTLFKSFGGACEEIHDARSKPDHFLWCQYTHGGLVMQEWRAVVYFDQTTRTSTDVRMFYGLTGL
jgi:hypothetical protein